MGAELVAAAFIMKEGVFFSNMMRALAFGTRFASVPVYVDSILILHVAGNWIYRSQDKHVGRRYFFVEELIK
ncbi:unnamed protein product [Sphacelaria rigidula]